MVGSKGGAGKVAEGFENSCSTRRSLAPPLRGWAKRRCPAALWPWGPGSYYRAWGAVSYLPRAHRGRVLQISAGRRDQSRLRPLRHRFPHREGGPGAEKPSCRRVRRPGPHPRGGAARSWSCRRAPFPCRSPGPTQPPSAQRPRTLTGGAGATLGVALRMRGVALRMRAWGHRDL